MTILQEFKFARNLLGQNYCRWFSTSKRYRQGDSDKEEPSVEDIQKIVLNTALEFVPIHGWTVQSLSEAAKHEGYPGVAHGMFPRGGGDLMHHFVKECNSQLAEQLALDTSKEVEEGERKKTCAVIRDALQTRLRMIIPYHAQWPEAMVLTARPENVAEHFNNLANLMDTIWYHAGDKSAHFNWYTKRISLAAVYKSSELCFIQDKSPDFEETWTFLDNRLTDFTRFAKLRGDVQSFDTVRYRLVAF
ncbi:ubiquinone biosynthesis protein COQ9, mitochondrial-like [Strongylocentrotus purpuratus]|uniref:Ubiquinone biosynthesis protein n=1 Tax=Strongylocentrotus purpuratus TaxID=7668 RepID=A0A7M7N9M5_STRPU|nr:ubiquinone biosynthesis protein COQ9, mitochondrial-like [Strongylocentrotus purpuratus]